MRPSLSKFSPPLYHPSLMTVLVLVRTANSLASLLTRVHGRFPNTKIWVTEYALAHQDLASTQAFYDESIAYLDGTDVIERYSYFGAFRSQVSNVGANATFLSQDGQLTQIGARYLGVGTTGVDPTSG